MAPLHAWDLLYSPLSMKLAGACGEPADEFEMALSGWDLSSLERRRSRGVCLWYGRRRKPIVCPTLGKNHRGPARLPGFSSSQCTGAPHLYPYIHGLTASND